MSETTPTQPYKAVMAFVGTFLAELIAAIVATDLAALDAKGWLLLVLTAAGVALGVYRVPNPAKAPKPHRAPSARKRQR